MKNRRSSWVSHVRADLKANAGYPKSAVALILLRNAQALRGTLLYPIAAAGYKLTVEWVLGIEIPPSTNVGPGLRLRHGTGVVVNPHAAIGANVMLRHGVTIGNRRDETDCPIIEDNVEIGAGATIIGNIRVGSGARIGAGAVVTKDVPAGGVAFLSGTVIR